jgi:hypothetical protein
MTTLQKVIAQVILASRYILVVFYIGLAVTLAVYAGQFLVKLAGLAASFPAADDNTFLIGCCN